MKNLKFSNAVNKPLCNRYERLSKGMGDENLNPNKTMSRYAITLLLSLTISPLLITGCDSYSQDPLQQTIPTNSERWQDKLGDTMEQLSEEDRQLLSRYMLRIRLSDAYEKGAMPRITIGKAIEQQREYEVLHPDNPTGAKSPVSARSQQQDFTLTLLPAQTSETDSLNNVQLIFVLANTSETAISSFKGTLLLRYPAFSKPKPVVIPLTKFDPPIAPKQGDKIVADVSISDTNVMKAIQNPQNIEIVITQGRLTLEDGTEINFDQ